MRALITGGSRGIGKAVVEVFESRGYEVVAPTRAELDLSNKDSVEAYVAAHANEELDTLVNNAGINDIARIEDAEDETIERMLEVDLVSPIRLLRGFVPALRKSLCGRVVNIGSIWAAVSWRCSRSRPIRRAASRCSTAPTGCSSPGTSWRAGRCCSLSRQQSRRSRRRRPDVHPY